MSIAEQCLDFACHDDLQVVKLRLKERGILYEVDVDGSNHYGPVWVIYFEDTSKLTCISGPLNYKISAE